MANNNENRNQGRNVKISREALQFSWEMKDYKKNMKKDGYRYDSKKELKAEWYYSLLDNLGEAIYFVVSCGYIRTDEVQEVKNGIFKNMVDPKFIKMVKRAIKDEDEIKNIDLFPIIIKEILTITAKANQEALAEDPNAKPIDLTDLAELSQLIMKKRLKKFKKADIDLNLAFDVLSVIPKTEILKRSQNYRIHMFYETLYEHSKTKTIDFAKVMKITADAEYYPAFIAFALLERKEKFARLNDAQKTFYLEVSNWVFDTMEKLDREEVEEIIRVYVRARRKDDSQGKDSVRRYALLSLSESDYPKIAKIVQKMIVDDKSIEKYLL